MTEQVTLYDGLSRSDNFCTFRDADSEEDLFEIFRLTYKALSQFRPNQFLFGVGFLTLYFARMGHHLKDGELMLPYILPCMIPQR